MFFLEKGTKHWQGYYFHNAGINGVEFHYHRGDGPDSDIAIDELKVRFSNFNQLPKPYYLFLNLYRHVLRKGARNVRHYIL